MTEIHSVQKMNERRKELRRKSTPEEEMLWQELRNSKFGYKFRRQHSIGGYVVDFYCAKARLVIEIDGDSHNTSDQKELDGIREEFLKDFNHKILRFKNSDVRNNIDEMISKIKKTVDNIYPSPKLGEGQG